MTLRIVTLTGLVLAGCYGGGTAATTPAPEVTAAGESACNGMIIAASVGKEDRPVLVGFTEDAPNGARLR